VILHRTEIDEIIAMLRQNAARITRFALNDEWRSIVVAEARLIGAETADCIWIGTSVTRVTGVGQLTIGAIPDDDIVPREIIPPTSIWTRLSAMANATSG